MKTEESSREFPNRRKAVNHVTDGNLATGFHAGTAADDRQIIYARPDRRMGAPPSAAVGRNKPVDSPDYESFRPDDRDSKRTHSTWSDDNHDSKCKLPPLDVFNVNSKRSRSPSARSDAQNHLDSRPVAPPQHHHRLVSYHQHSGDHHQHSVEQRPHGDHRQHGVDNHQHDDPCLRRIKTESFIDVKSRFDTDCPGGTSKALCAAPEHDHQSDIVVDCKATEKSFEPALKRPRLLSVDDRPRTLPPPTAAGDEMTRCAKANNTTTSTSTVDILPIPPLTGTAPEKTDEQQQRSKISELLRDTRPNRATPVTSSIFIADPPHVGILLETVGNQSFDLLNDAVDAASVSTIQMSSSSPAAKRKQVCAGIKRSSSSKSAAVADQFVFQDEDDSVTSSPGKSHHHRKNNGSGGPQRLDVHRIAAVVNTRVSDLPLLVQSKRKRKNTDPSAIVTPPTIGLGRESCEGAKLASLSKSGRKRRTKPRPVVEDIELITLLSPEKRRRRSTSVRLSMSEVLPSPEKKPLLLKINNLQTNPTISCPSTKEGANTGLTPGIVTSSELVDAGHAPPSRLKKASHGHGVAKSEMVGQERVVGPVVSSLASPEVKPNASDLKLVINRNRLHPSHSFSATSLNRSSSSSSAATSAKNRSLHGHRSRAVSETLSDGIANGKAVTPVLPQNPDDGSGLTNIEEASVGGHLFARGVGVKAQDKKSLKNQPHSGKSGRSSQPKRKQSTTQSSTQSHPAVPLEFQAAAASPFSPVL